MAPAHPLQQAPWGRATSPGRSWRAFLQEGEAALWGVRYLEIPSHLRRVMEASEWWYFFPFTLSPKQRGA